MFTTAPVQRDTPLIGSGKLPCTSNATNCRYPHLIEITDKASAKRALPKDLVCARYKNNDRNTFMLLFEKDFPNMAAARYEQNEDFFVKLFSEPDMMQQVMKTMGPILYERLRNAT